jgi:RNA polymerase sigma factor (sigma-70 family)
MVLDVRMPGMSGLELQQRLADEGAPLQVIMLTAHGDVPMAVRAMHAGAFDFVQKPYNGQALLERVQAAVRAVQRQSERQEETGTLKRRVDSLTPREREVLELVAAGEPNKRIAQLLGVSLRTVEVHRHNVMGKLEAHTVGDLIRIYLAVKGHPE